MPDFNWDAKFLDSVGMEKEGILLNKELMPDRLFPVLKNLFPNKSVINITRDASTEFIADLLRIGPSRSLYVSSHTKASRNINGIGRGNSTVFGYELYTNPLSIEEMEKLVFPLIYTLVEMGDSVSKRAAVHFHVGFAQNLRLMKRLLKICLALDPVLFRLGGMGGTFRGYCNNAAYARPLLAPLAVKLVQDSGTVPSSLTFTNRTFRDTANAARNFARELERNATGTSSWEEPDEDSEEFDEEIREEQEIDSSPRINVYNQLNFDYSLIINAEQALGAADIETFWASFGVSSRNIRKTHPSRYTGCNFYSILAHGTMEFRHFNDSLNPILLISIAKFLRAVVDVSTQASKEDILSFSVYSPTEEISMADADEVMSRIVYLFHKNDIQNAPNRFEVNTLMETLEQSTFKPLSEIHPICHINDFALVESLRKRGNLKVVDVVSEPEHIDIHNIDRKFFSLFDSNQEMS